MLRAGGPKNTVQIETSGVRCVKNMHCLNMLQGYILPRLVGDVFTLLILRGRLDYFVGHSVSQRLVDAF